jgi:dTDP-4-dehydrorhamnose 3,5-epimerase
MSVSDNEISGVIFKKLRSYPDQRGFFREIIRFNDPIFENGKFAQWSHSKMTKDVVKAWHYHHLQTDWWYVSEGLLEAVLFDNREESPTYKKKLVFKMGNSDSDESIVAVKIVPGVLHGCKVLSEEAHLMYITSETYNPNDEGRFAYNSSVVPHDWGSNAITAENDRRNFEPTAKRIKE